MKELPPELPGGLTFHLPLEIQAMELLGADESTIYDRIEMRLPIAFNTGLVDPPYFRWAERHYSAAVELLLSDRIDDRVSGVRAVASLGDGLAGAAFHGLIRVGYGAMRRDSRELARGLAYMRARRQTLLSGAGRSMPGADDLPPLDELNTGTVVEQLNVVAGGGRSDVDEMDLQVDESVVELCADALQMVRHDPSSFVAVHALTGLHALVEFERLVTGGDAIGGLAELDGLLRPWWRAEATALRACSALVRCLPPQEVAPTVAATSLKDLADVAMKSCEVHDLKVVLSLWRLTDAGIIDVDTALEVGNRKLSATECQPI